MHSALNDSVRAVGPRENAQMMTTGMARLRALTAEALLDAWAVVQPVECAGCRVPDRGVCRTCRDAIGLLRPRLIAEISGVPVFAAGVYRDPLRSLIRAGKDAGRGDALRALAPVLRRTVETERAHLVDDAEVAWIPSTARAMRHRGHDPVRTLLRTARLPASRVLAARRAPPQKSLDRRDRAALASERFRVVGRVAARRFLLVDDVVTTGATVCAAATVLRAAGANVVSVVCIARVELQLPIRDSSDARR